MKKVFNVMKPVFKPSLTRLTIFALFFLLVVLSCLPFAIAADGEVLVLGFNEGAGNPIMDSSSYAHNVTTSGTVVWTASGKYGGAYRIPHDYTSKKIVVSDDPVLNLTGNFTIMAWIYPSDRPSDYLTIISKSTDDTDSWTFRTSSSGYLGLVIGNGTAAAWLQSMGAVTYNAWNHVAVSLDRDTGQVRFYINGNSSGTSSYHRDVSANANDVTIGSRPNNVNKYNGTIDELRIFSTPLSQSQIQSHMNTPIGDACTDYDGDHYYPQPSGCDSEPGFLGYGECNDSNSEIHPYASEICGNSVDENCDGQDLQCQDTTPPVRYNGQPSGSLQAGTNQTTLSLSTNEAAMCKYSTTAGVSYDSMPNTFSTTGHISHSQLISGLVGSSSYAFYVRCKDVLNNKNSDDFAITFSVISCTDADGDHFYAESSGCDSEPGFQGHDDCDDTNASIHPGATDFCENGVDEDCNGQDLQCGQIPENSYYVSSDGNDDNPGSIDQPWKTIQKAADALTAGDTVYIREGVYREQVIPKNSGNSIDGYITYAAYPDETVTIDGNGIPLGTWDGLFNIESRSYIKVSGLRLLNAAHNGGDQYDGHAINGIRAQQSDHIIIEHNYIYNTVSSGIGIWGSHDVVLDGNEIVLACNGGSEEVISIASTSYNVVVKNNKVHDTFNSPYGGEGINIKDGSHDVNITGNYVYDHPKLAFGVDAWTTPTYNIRFWNNTARNTSYGFILESEQGNTTNPPAAAYNLWVYNNIAIDVSSAAYALPPWGESHRGPVRDAYFINNVAYNCGVGFWARHTDIWNITIHNNIFSQNSHPICIPSGTQSRFTIDHNIIYASGSSCSDLWGEFPFVYYPGIDYLTTNPSFVNPAANNFHLASGSPAIDSGSSLYAPVDDMDGVSRPQVAGYDIGAYEFVPGSSIPGDLNHDTYVNLLDLQEVTSRFGLLNGEPGWDPIADIVSPYGEIDIFDVVYVASRFT